MQKHINTAITTMFFVVGLYTGEKIYRKKVK